MTRTCLMLVAAFILLLAALPPVIATLVLSDVSLTPNPPLVAGSQQHLVATYAVIPSGATTFATGHSLQMQTDLAGAKWSIQVTLDGRNAAQQSATGNAAFVNGEILSYSTSHDVGMVVTIDGTVPKTESDQLMVLQVEEIDNSGNVVPGSVITITQPMAGQPAPAPTVAVPTRTLPPMTPAAQPTKAPGFTASLGTIALCAGFILCFRRYARSRTI
jgi:hypothetical protein